VTIHAPVGQSPVGQIAGVHRAPAKLTLSLRVTGVRDDGYHLIDAEMVTIDLADDLTFSEGDGLEVDVVGAAAPVPTDDSNLVRRALRAVAATAHVRLTKRIPAGGGLGGGSADAAAVLRWAGVTDLDVAAALGADVPFCLVGGRARVTGVGEIIDPLPFEPRAFTLLTPSFGVSTPRVYMAWDEMGGPTAAGVNDLEPAALAVEPRLAEWRDRLGEATGATPVLAGSGSTWFVEGEFPGPGLLVVHAEIPPIGVDKEGSGAG
jgi:4-diphosphocytidyl-2-C-methyl-D-erythritol kinase